MESPTRRFPKNRFINGFVVHSIIVAEVERAVGDRIRSKWLWISSLTFGVFAGLIKAIFIPYPEYNPPAIYPAMVAFLLAAIFWWRLIVKSDRVTFLRGGSVGGIVGLLTPPLAWPFFLLTIAVSENRFPEIFVWSPIYMLLSLYHVSWLTMLTGIILGFILVQFQRKASEDLPAIPT